MRKLVVILCLITSCFCNKVHSQCDRTQDSLALIALYNSTEGPDWTNTWNLNEPIDTWYGIEVNANGCIAEVDLIANNLTGIIPNQFYDLTEINRIYLPNNNLSGELSNDISNFIQLNTIDIGLNEFSGAIPISITTIGTLRNVRLQFNNFEGSIPSEFGNMTELRTLVLADNNLTGDIPPELGNMLEIRTLDLNNNQLQGEIPLALGTPTLLNRLWLGGNQLIGCFPDFICNGENQAMNNKELPWSGDKIPFCNGEDQIGAPCDDCNPITADDRIQDDCSCKGRIISTCRAQDSLALIALYNATDGLNWTNTWNLNLPMDTWYGIELTSEGCVRCIDMDGLPSCSVIVPINSANYGNNLRGELPDEIYTLSSLEHLVLFANFIEGGISPSVGNLSNLKTLSLKKNLLTDSIPDEIGLCTELEIFLVDENQIVGDIPSSFGNCRKLRRLETNINNMTGIIPPELGNCDSLEFLLIGSNSLTGTIPDELGNLSNLKWLWINNTFNLEGSIPSSLGNLSELVVLKAHWNKLSGTLPTELGNLTQLEELSLYRNELIDTIPQSYTQLSNLKDLRLSFNNLEGEIPSGFANISSLEYFYLHENNLGSCFPEDLLDVCSLGFSVDGNGTKGYNFTANPLLPFEGDYLRVCNGEEQIGASCDDGDSTTIEDEIQEDCSCGVMELIDEICDNNMDDDGDGLVDCDDPDLAQDCCCLPPVSFDTIDDIMMCEGDTEEVIASSGFTSYEWSESGTVISINNSIVVSQENMYLLSVIDSCGNSFNDSFNVSFQGTSMTQDTMLVICEDEEVVINGTSYSMAGTYQQTIDQSGCDAILNINIEVLPQQNETENYEICEGEEVIANGTSYSQSGTFNNDIVGANGCPATLSVIVETINPVNQEIDRTFCDDDGVTINDVTYTDAGMYIQDFIDINGCDATLTINLTSEDCSSCGSSVNVFQNTLQVKKLSIAESKVEISANMQVIFSDRISNDKIETIFEIFSFLEQNQARSVKEKKLIVELLLENGSEKNLLKLNLNSDTKAHEFHLTQLYRQFNNLPVSGSMSIN